MTNPSQLELLGLSRPELETLVTTLGEPAFRARQLMDALYRQRVATLDEVSTLPKSLRLRLSEAGYRTGLPRAEQRFVSRDGTVRYLVAFADGQSVETVWMPDGDGAEDAEDPAAGELQRSSLARRGTICLSSQSGCAVNCGFCMTALLGFQRNLSAGEIVGQILLVLKDQRLEIGKDRVNLVFMGQGEPFLNYENFMSAVRLLVEVVGLSEARMTVSTSGILPRFEQFGQEPVRPRLAISLNASNQELREQVMPITRKWKLPELIEAARAFPLRMREVLTFEYVLLAGVNDSQEHAREVIELLRGIRAKVNLIALNPGPEIDYKTPLRLTVDAFQRTLVEAGLPAFLRRPRGRDIYAACGQLKRTTQLVALSGPSAEE